MTRLTFVPEDSIPYDDSLHQSNRLELKAAPNMDNTRYSCAIRKHQNHQWWMMQKQGKNDNCTSLSKLQVQTRLYPRQKHNVAYIKPINSNKNKSSIMYDYFLVRLVHLLSVLVFDNPNVHHALQYIPYIEALVYKYI